jgi:protein ImuB
MPVAEALAFDPNLSVQEEDPKSDLQTLQRLAQRMERYSPIVGLEDAPVPESLLLDITGCAACFRGEDKLLRLAVDDLLGEGWAASVAVADTVGAAWAVSHYAKTPCRVPPGEVERFLRSLPVACLRLPSETADLLARLGIESVEQLMSLERSAIFTRFGPLLLRRLDQALGRRPEVIVAHRVPDDVQASLAFDYPTSRLDLVNDVLARLTQRIHETLRGRNQGARWIECVLYREAASPLRLEVGLCRPSHSPEHIAALLLPLLERTPIDGLVYAMTLRVSSAEPLVDRHAEFFETESQEAGKSLAILLDGLSSRLGPQAVTRARLVPDAQPEYACCFEPLIEIPAQRQREPAIGRATANSRKTKHDRLLQSPSSLLRRPVRLGKPKPIDAVSVIPEGPPIRIFWAGTEYRVLHAWGPERVETGWWRGEDVRRDYYLAATHLGNRFWIFRRRDDDRWFLHGCFD